MTDLMREFIARIDAGGELTEDETREFAKQAGVVDVVLGDWPDGPLARRTIMRALDDERTFAVEWHRTPGGDGTDEWPISPYPVQRVEEEQTIIVHRWVPTDD